jgi:hypothetical protein
LPLQSKREVAREILNAVIEIYRHPEPEPEPEDHADRVESETLLERDVELEEALSGENHLPRADESKRKSRRRGKRRGGEAAPPSEPIAVAPSPPASAVVSAATPELPLPAPGTAGHKRTRGRRGGRRAARARARKLALQSGEGPAVEALPDPPPVPSAAETPLPAKKRRAPESKPGLPKERKPSRRKRK